jgi:hypothetical protein
MKRDGARSRNEAATRTYKQRVTEFASQPIEMRAFLTEMLATQGIDAATKSVPFWLAHGVALLTTALWTLLRARSSPPMTHTAVHLLGEEVTVRDDKIRRELGYRGAVTRAEGLREMVQG